MTPETGTNPSFLPDTNILIALLNKEETVERRLSGKSVYLAGVVLGELYFGVFRSGRVEGNLKKLEAFIADYPILNCDRTTAKYYGQIKQALYSKGRPIPENDIWIAALVLQHRLKLVTRDKHFQAIDDFSMEVW